MRIFCTLLKHEIKSLLLSASTYIIAMLFLFFMCITFVVIVGDYSSATKNKLPSEIFFSAFVIPTLFIIPLITMRSIAEERRTGTLGTMLTTMVTPTEFVLSKYFGAYFLYMCLWGLALGFPMIIMWGLPNSAGAEMLFNLKSFIGGYIFIAISGLVYIAVGIFASSVTRSQVVAGMLSFCLLFLLIVGGHLLNGLPNTDMEASRWAQNIIDYMQILQHRLDFSRGLIDSRPIFLYISNAILLLWVSTRIVEAKA